MPVTWRDLSSYPKLSLKMVVYDGKISMSRCFTRSTLPGALLLFGIVALFVAMIRPYHSPAFGGTDENGYILTAKWLALRGDAGKHTVDPYEFVSGNWVETQNNVYYAKYPIGYPLLCAAAYRMGGPEAVFWINPILATLAIAGMFFLGRIFIGNTAGGFAALLLAANPMLAHFSLSALSHSGSVCFAVWGMFFVWRWTQHGGWWNAVLGSVFTAYALTVRYTEALLALPLLAMVVWRCVEVLKTAPPGQRRRTARQLAAQIGLMLAAAALTVTPLFLHHWAAYGSPWVNGYSLCDESTGFSWVWFQKNWRLMLGRMDWPGLFLIFPIGLAGLAWLAAYHPKRALFLGLWAMPGLLLYTAYYWAPEGDGPGYIRFFTSIFPAFILSALSLLCLAAPPRRTWTVAMGGLVLLIAGVNLDESCRRLEQAAERLRFNKAMLDTVSANLPSNSVILSDDHVLNFVEYAGNFRLYSFDIFSRSALQNKTKVLNDNNPHPFQRQKAAKLRKLFGNKNDAQLADIQRDRVARLLAAGKRVTVISRKDGMQRWRGRLSDRFAFSNMTEYLEIQTPPKGDPRPTVWSLVAIRPRPPGEAAGKPAEMTALQETIDRAQFRLDHLRTEHNEKYPGAAQSMARINDLEKDLRDLREKQKRLLAKAPAAKPPHPASPPLASSSNAHPALATLSVTNAIRTNAPPAIAAAAVAAANPIARGSSNVVALVASAPFPQPTFAGAALLTNLPSVISSPPPPSVSNAVITATATNVVVSVVTPPAPVATRTNATQTVP
ncbi:MAG: hypothetical protein HY360_20355 [Verrucomicrobia bacterium]|nr:hypothetical protein [Verrucomicrobiota bacterium]